MAAVLAVGLIGLLRLGRQFPAAAESPGLLIPFLMPVLTLALEAGALVALSAAVLSLGPELMTKPLAERVKAALPLLGLLLASLALAELLPRGTERPGALANDLIERASASCGAGKALVPIPLLGLNVRCGQPSRVEGPMPGAASVQLGMQQLRFSDDLRSVEITDLELSAKRSLSLKLQVGTARIVGLSPWTRSPRLSRLGRFSIVGAVGGALWLAALAVIRGWRPGPNADAPPRRFWRALTLLLLASPGSAAAAVLVALDQGQADPPRYALSALAGVGVLLSLQLLFRRARFSGRFLMLGAPPS
ncbi:MAG TPA: hypothetical protein VJN18_09060 [Polyangiaceae bacterium]|nr:hypothetical protein [Polyangiaceae bacterium]